MIDRKRTATPRIPPQDSPDWPASDEIEGSESCQGGEYWDQKGMPIVFVVFRKFLMFISRSTYDYSSSTKSSPMLGEVRLRRNAS